MTLKEAIKDYHEAAEKSKFATLLLSGNITSEEYADLLCNMLEIYKCLEEHCDAHHLLDEVPGIKRSDLIRQDLEELNQPQAKLQPMTTRYVEYLSKLSKFNPKLLLAHVYVRHFGDLYGGQIVKSKVPGTGRMYEFVERAELITKMRSILTDDLGDEAKRAMNSALVLFEELANEHSL